jgi:maleate cis-trans isomerase
MYGSKAKIGLLLPSANTIMEGEFNALKPAGVSVHAARMLIRFPNIEELAKMAEETEKATELISTAKPSIIAFGCTAGSVLNGLGWDEKLISRIQKISKVHATTTATAVIRAFKELEIHKIAVVTPYIEELNKLEKDFFEDSGITVLEIRGIDLGGEEMEMLTLEKIADHARAVNRSDADAVFLSCTNLQALPIVEQLEKELGKYVFSSNIATYWDVMRRLGIKQSITGMGKLLEGI